MMETIVCQLSFLLLASTTSATSASIGMKSFKPVLGSDGKSIQCAVDPPTAVVPLTDLSVGIPVGVPDNVVCGFGCTAYSGCSSYNYRKPRAAPAQCEMYTTVPRNCSTMTSDEQCQHYEISGFKRSCAPPVCDVNCVSGCMVQRDAKCDSLCGNGTALSTNFTCQPCSAKCVSGCPQQGAGKCDSQCASGFGLDTTHVCQPCCANCVSGCAAQGAGKCDSQCSSGYGLDLNHVCQVCSAHCQSGCAVQGAGKCDTQCASGYGLNENHVCQPCCTNCVGGCAQQGSGKCDSQCATGSSLDAYYVCQTCCANCASGCATQGAGRCDSLCASGFGLDGNHVCQLCDSHCVSACSTKGAGKCDSQCTSGYFLAADSTCQQITCPTGYTYITYANAGTCYLLSSDLSSWSTAALRCANVGASLAHIESDDEQTALVNFITNSNYGHSVWIGGCRLSDSTFVWSSQCSNNGVPSSADKSTMTFRTWSPTEPASNSKDCVKMSKDNSFKWAVEDCVQERNYICEFH